MAQVPVPRAGEDHPVRGRHARVREVHRAHRGRGDVTPLRRALVVIDGEHYAPVVRDAVATLRYEVVAAWLAGGTEKLRGGEDYGVPVVRDFDEALRDVDVVVDLSDEPVVGPRRRLKLASRALAAGVAYEGADFRFDVPVYEPFPLPSLAVIGTGKRVGKTALTGHVARLLARELDVVVVAMGRGGPEEPQVIETPPDLDALVALSRSGQHAASDHLETAALAGVVTIGCRRAGGGLAGAVMTSNVHAGAALAAERQPDVVIFDGSGASIPPVDLDARILVTTAAHDLDAFLNPYRVLVSDLIVAVGGGIRAPEHVPVIDVDLRLQPVTPLRGRRVAVFTTGPAPTDHLDAEIVSVSRNLADRARLRDDLERTDADVYVVELKAAAIDVVAEAALERGVELVLAQNDVVPREGEDLDGRIRDLLRTKAPA